MSLTTAFLCSQHCMNVWILTGRVMAFLWHWDRQPQCQRQVHQGCQASTAGRIYHCP